VVERIKYFFNKEPANHLIGKESAKLLCLLVLADFVFMLLHCYYGFAASSNSLLLISADLGYAEVYQYIKEFWIVLLLIILAKSRRQFVYFAWSLLFIYLFVDDSFRVHERFGAYLVDNFGFQSMFRLRAQDFGELSVSLFFGLLFLIFIGASYYFGDHLAKSVSRQLFILVMVLAFFGVLVDMLQIALPLGSLGKGVFVLIEDGGEMLTMSIIVWHVFNQRVNPGESISIK
tara:strand:+ start:123 stop:818 length:696 start_codon:yes stop_codon:yes gene_type:complete